MYNRIVGRCGIVILKARHIIIVTIDVNIRNLNRIVFRHLLMLKLCIKSVHSMIKSVHSVQDLSKLICNLL